VCCIHRLNPPPKPVTRFSIILVRSKGRIAWLQRKVLVAIGAVAATIPIVAFQQAPVSRHLACPGLVTLESNRNIKGRVNEIVVYCCGSWIFSCRVRE
jgi:hypothetical protein